MKYNIGDLVWVLGSKEIKYCKVVARSFFEAMDMDSNIITKVEYTLKDGNGLVIDYREVDVFDNFTDFLNEKTLPYEPGN